MLSDERLSWIELGSKTTQLDIVALVAEVRELRQQQKRYEVCGQGQTVKVECRKIRDLRQRAEQAEAQVAVLTGYLNDMVILDDGLRDALANLPALATALLSERERMRVALANAIEAAVEQKMHTGMVCVASCDTDGECCRQVSNLMASERCYQRAREALREEDTATDA